MNEKDHPLGLNPKQRKEWHKLWKRMFELYDLMPIGENHRKIIAGHDAKGYIAFIFIGDQKDAEQMRTLLYGENNV